MKIQMLFIAKNMICWLVILFYMSIAGCSKSRISNVSSPIFDPTGKKILFTLVDDKGSDIYQTDREGSIVRRVIDPMGYYFDAIYSPDGSKIVFCRMQKQGQADLYLINLDGSNMRQLTKSPEHDFNPVFSHNGEKVYFLRAKWFGNYSPLAQPSWHKLDIYSVNIDGSGLNPITQNEFYEISDINIFPDDATLLARIIYEEGIDVIWKIPINNPNKMKSIRPILDPYVHNIKEGRLNTNPVDYQFIGNLDLSQDGSLLAFTWAGHCQGYFGHEIYVMNMRTKETIKVTEQKSLISHLSFSPNGKEIIFSINAMHVGKPSDGLKIFIINLDGTDLRSINVFD